MAVHFLHTTQCNTQCFRCLWMVKLSDFQPLGYWALVDEWMNELLFNYAETALITAEGLENGKYGSLSTTTTQTTPPSPSSPTSKQSFKDALNGIVEQNDYPGCPNLPSEDDRDKAVCGIINQCETDHQDFDDICKLVSPCTTTSKLDIWNKEWLIYLLKTCTEGKNHFNGVCGFILSMYLQQALPK